MGKEELKDAYTQELSEIKSTDCLRKIWKSLLDLRGSDNKIKNAINGLHKYFPCGYGMDDEKTSEKYDELYFIENLKVTKDNVENCDSSVYKAMAWKNGDLGKENLIREAFSGDAADIKVKADGTISVFYQFGKFLKTYSEAEDDFSKVEPIADQHTFRAYLYFVKNSEEGLSRDTFPQKFKEDWIEYRKWYKGIIEECFKTDEATNKEAFWLLNHIMFVLGKAIKE